MLDAGRAALLEDEDKLTKQSALQRKPCSSAPSARRAKKISAATASVLLKTMSCHLRCLAAALSNASPLGQPQSRGAAQHHATFFCHLSARTGQRPMKEKVFATDLIFLSAIKNKIKEKGWGGFSLPLPPLRIVYVILSVIKNS